MRCTVSSLQYLITGLAEEYGGYIKRMLWTPAPASSSGFIEVQNHDDGDGMGFWNIVWHFYRLTRLYARGFSEFYCILPSSLRALSYNNNNNNDNNDNNNNNNKVVVIKVGLFLSLLPSNVYVKRNV
jgi:hypothetical protein